MILEHYLVSLKHPSPLFSWFRFWTCAKSRMDSSLSIPSLRGGVLSWRAAAYRMLRQARAGVWVRLWLCRNREHSGCWNLHSKLENTWVVVV